MSAGGDDDATASRSWTNGMPGTNGELLLLLTDSIMDLGNWLQQLTAMAERRASDTDKMPAVDIGGQLVEPFEWFANELAGPAENGVGGVSGVVADLLTENVALASYLMQYSQTAKSEPPLSVMRHALLISAVAGAETMLIRVLRRIQHDREDATLLGALWKAPRLDVVVRRPTRVSIEDWAPKLYHDLGVDLPAAACDWLAVIEIWERTNVLVHSRGLADKKYVERVPGAVLGALLEVDGRYLREAIDLLCGFVLCFAFKTWAVCPGYRNLVIEMATLYAATAESELRWPLVESLHALLAQLEEDPILAAASQISTWLARIHWHGHHSVLPEVGAWPVADLPPRFTLAKTILLGRRDEAVAMLPSLIDQGEITRDNLQCWPLFELLRGETEFQFFLAG
jgi:hypothetical protein